MVDLLALRVVAAAFRDSLLSNGHDLVVYDDKRQKLHIRWMSSKLQVPFRVVVYDVLMLGDAPLQCLHVYTRKLNAASIIN